jgi:hypothetical protein
MSGALKLYSFLAEPELLLQKIKVVIRVGLGQPTSLQGTVGRSTGILGKQEAKHQGIHFWASASL